MAVAASIPQRELLLLAAFELENRLAAQHRSTLRPSRLEPLTLGICNRGSSRVPSVARQRGARRFPWPPLRHPLRPGAGARKLASTDDAPLRRFDLRERFGAPPVNCSL